MKLHFEDGTVDPETIAIALVGATVIAMVLINLLVEGTSLAVALPWLLI